MTEVKIELEVVDNDAVAAKLATMNGEQVAAWLASLGVIETRIMGGKGLVVIGARLIDNQIRMSTGDGIVDAMAALIVGLSMPEVIRA